MEEVEQLVGWDGEREFEGSGFLRHKQHVTFASAFYFIQAVGADDMLLSC